MKHVLPKGWRVKVLNGALAVMALALPAHTRVVAGQDRAQKPEMFSSPAEAVRSFTATVKTQSKEALLRLFGPEVASMENPDRVQAVNELNAIADALDKGHRLVRESETKYVLEIGTNRWPFPIPIIQQSGRWYFDTDAGKEELLNRRIGQNELKVLEGVRAYAEAQRAYAAQDRDGDDVLEYAQRLASSAATQDGLFWAANEDEEQSPLGPLVAQAQSEGYVGQTPRSKAGPEPFHGYVFRILTRQGKHAPGGKYDYVINGNMIGGFALIAWPAEYGHSGIMTFILNQQGRVYQKDLGPGTGKVVRKITAYDPDGSWSLSPD